MSEFGTSELHSNSIVIDAVSPLLMKPEYVDWYIEGGVTAVAPTVGGWTPSSYAVSSIASWLEIVRRKKNLKVIKSAADIEQCKREGLLGLIFHFQGTDPLDDDLNLVSLFKELGVGVMQLTYNVKNRVGDGAQERTDAGLSHFGVEFIKRCNENRVIIDCSHTGHRTTMEAIELSQQPVIFSHANPKAVHESPRNITDEQIKAVAATGGVVGTCGFPGFVSDSSRPSLDEFINHIDHIVQLVGTDHAGLGIDYYLGQHLVADPDQAMAVYEKFVASGIWRQDAYPPPPHRYPSGIETPKSLANLTDGLRSRGYGDLDVQKILGQNWLRVYRDVWGG